MNLISPKDLVKANTNLNLIGGEKFAKLLMNIFQLNKLNKVYSSNYNKDGIEFIDSLINDLGIKFEFDEEELKRIPKDGSFITISNHPFGGIDGIILIKILSLVRNDFKTMANFLLKKIEPIQNCFLGVNPFENRQIASSTSGIIEGFRHIKKGSPLGIFPAGEVSSYQSVNFKVKDKKWSPSILKFIKKNQVPVVPIYFKGNNSLIFHLLGLVHPSLRTVKLPSELFNKKKKTIQIRIGKPISVEEQNNFSDINQYGRFLRAKTYLLGSPIEVKKFYKFSKNKTQEVEEIAKETDLNLIESEIKNLSEKHLLFKNKKYNVYCSPSKLIPNILNEIGRLREITFRAVGEGTNQSADLDEYDIYYNQLFIWDEEHKKIVGAYRIGKGSDILSEFGIKGFYLRSLFKINKKFNTIMNQSIELGRSFIRKEYQRKPLPLFMLWKGILCFLLKNPEYRYMIGPVSISNNYSDRSKEFIIKFIMKNYFDFNLAKQIKSKKKFKVRFKNTDVDFLINNVNNDINKLDKVIGDFELTNEKLPVLLKKYISLNAKIIGFNVDPLFNNCLDGLIVLDFYNIPNTVVQSLTKEFTDTKEELSKAAS